MTHLNDNDEQKVLVSQTSSIEPTVYECLLFENPNFGSHNF